MESFQTAINIIAFNSNDLSFVSQLIKDYKYILLQKQLHQLLALKKCKIENFLIFPKYFTYSQNTLKTPNDRKKLYQISHEQRHSVNHQLVSVLQKDGERRTENQSFQGLIKSSQTLVPQKPQSRQLKLKKKQKNFLKLIYRLYPSLQQSHTFRLFGFLGINEKAIQNPDCAQSLLFTHFQTCVIQKIEFFDYAIVIEMAEPTIPFYQPSLDYIIEKYKAKGDYRYWQLSFMIQEVAQLFKKAEKNPKTEEQVETTKKCLNSLGNQMYVCCLSSRKFAISKPLLTYLGYDLNEFSIEAIKYRSIFTEFFSAINYSVLLKHLLNTLKYTALLNLQQISLAQFKMLSQLNYDGFVQSKNHIRTYCNMTISLIGPAFLCHKVNFIYYQQGEASIKKQQNPNMILAIQEEKLRIKEAQYNTINQIKPLPRHLLRQNKNLFAVYKDIARDEQEQQKQQQKN